MKGDESAFPTQMWDEELKEATWLDGGLTKREYFAAMAMQGLLAGVYSTKEMLNEFAQAKHSPGDDLFARSYVSGCDAVSRNAVSYADAILVELEKRK
jgi:hypothetical protein